MEEDQAIKILEGYRTSLAEIESRFTKDRNGIHINIDDITIVKQLVIETRDSLNDLFGDNDYSRMIADSYNDGISNMTGSPSLHCVKDIQAIISSAVTRIKNNPNILNPKEQYKEAKENIETKVTEIPEKITLAWLFSHVPIKFWLGAGALIISAFLFGIKASQWAFIKEIFGLTK